MKNEKVIIVGAGLCGSLLGILLAKEGYSVQLLEKRPDLRSHDISAGRSINLALSDRGLKALEIANVENELEELMIPMPGRILHPEKGKPRLSAYSGRDHDYINSISRTGLNALLLDKLESYSNVNIEFEQECKKVYLAENKVQIEKDGELEWIHGDLIFGADGAGSVMRYCMGKIARKRSLAFENKSEFLDYGYKELSFPPGKGGQWQIECNGLHIWPRGSFMMIALPNLDGSFTVTLFLPLQAEFSFEYLEDRSKREAFFEEYFPDSIPLFEDLHKEYEENPVGKLGTVFCKPWSITEKSCLIGDAAHAIVPFYGQGMNCAFEDILVLKKYMEVFKGHWPSIFKAFAEERKEDTDAIASLAIDNFYEMRDHVAQAQFAKKRGIEMELERKTNDYYSKYSLVTFREDLPYKRAMKQGRFQDEYILSKLEEDKNIDATAIYEGLQKEFAKRNDFSMSTHQ